MNKKIWFIGIIVILSLVIIGSLIFITNAKKTNTINYSTGVTIFNYNGKTTTKELTNEDLETITCIFNNKRMFSDTPSCGFSENIAIIFDETDCFCIACDSCPIIYFKNKNLFFKLTEHENNILKEILIKYGFQFPCV